MTTISISLSDDRLAKLRKLAQETGLTPEQLLEASVEALLARQKLDFDQAAAYVLKKNAGLYRRLAQCDT